MPTNIYATLTLGLNDGNLVMTHDMIIHGKNSSLKKRVIDPQTGHLNSTHPWGQFEGMAILDAFSLDPQLPSSLPASHSSGHS